MIEKNSEIFLLYLQVLFFNFFDIFLINMHLLWLFEVFDKLSWFALYHFFVEFLYVLWIKIVEVFSHVVARGCFWRLIPVTRKGLLGADTVPTVLLPGAENGLDLKRKWECQTRFHLQEEIQEKNVKPFGVRPLQSSMGSWWRFNLSQNIPQQFIFHYITRFLK